MNTTSIEIPSRYRTDRAFDDGTQQAYIEGYCAYSPYDSLKDMEPTYNTVAENTAFRKGWYAAKEKS